MSAYKDALTAAMNRLARDPRVVFLGYGVATGSKALGTLKEVPPSRLIEMPVAENLMVGAALGMALAGKVPVVFIERMDFLMNAMDALVNHLDKIAVISRGQFRPQVIIRCVVGNSQKPLFTGRTHTQEFTYPLRYMLKMDVRLMSTVYGIEDCYGPRLLKDGCSLLTAEYKDLH